MTTVWIVGRFIAQAPEGAVWEFQGVHATEAEAGYACRDATYFIGPCTIGRAIPHETQPEWPGAYYPRSA